jgi:MgtE-like protein
MKKLIIPFVAAFGLSLGIATGVVMMRAPKAAPVQVAAKAAEKPKTDSVATTADTTAVQAIDSASLAAIAPTVDSLHATSVPAGVADAPMTAGSNPGPAQAGGHAVPAAGASGSRQIVPATANIVTKLASVPAATVKSVPVAAKAPADSLIGRRLAQVFGAMQSKDAARVLEQMDDVDVRAILGSLSSKQQAAILGSFPTQRAAVILQATLRTAAGGTE